MQPAAMQESKARPKEEAGRKKVGEGGGGGEGEHILKPLIFFFQMALFFLFRFFFPAES